MLVLGLAAWFFVRPMVPSRHPDRPHPGGLDPDRWISTKEGDFRESLVKMEPEGRLRLRADTLGTRDDTVKALGIRSAKDYPLSPSFAAAARVDWNGQVNGSYLAASLVLSPEAGTGNPLAGADWVKIEYVGVPPGTNGRLQVVLRKSGRDRILHSEGWPENRSGRKLGLQHLRVSIIDGALHVVENGAAVLSTPAKTLAFPRAYVYFQLTSHSNFPAREVFIDQIEIPRS